MNWITGWLSVFPQGHFFDLSLENEIFEKEGVESYRKYQTEHEGDILRPVPVFRW